ncbi:MAG TPA: glycoside hydrolase family 36 protein, partial [Candidatus Binataceae bacterium]
MRVTRVELRFGRADGTNAYVNHAPSAVNSITSTESEGIELLANIDELFASPTVRVTVRNKTSEEIKLDSVTIEVATGFASHRPARFMKHGYQSWSGSGPVQVGDTRPHPRDSAPSIVRINHQSEARRPDGFPEAATSEMFAIVTSAASRDSILAGFAGAEHELTTITVPSPDRVLARVLLDGVVLSPGAERAIEPLILDSGESPSLLAWRWASVIGDRMGARTNAPYQRGWCSWYHYFHAITEDALRANLRALASMRQKFPVEVVQLDDGFQAALGDWDVTNSKFPSGLKRIAQEIRDAGFIAGIWTAPFFAAQGSQIMREHPDWFIRHTSAGPLKAGYNPDWTADEDKFAYALDPSNPGFRDHLERLFRKLTDEFGYAYLKLDFLYAGAAEGIRHDPNLTRAEALRRGLEAIRAGAGDKTFILGCGCPLGQAIGIVDGMRIGPDVAPFWGS